MLQTES